MATTTPTSASSLCWSSSSMLSLSKYCALLLVLSLSSSSSSLNSLLVAAEIRLPQFNRSFASLPGLFGGTLDENDPPVLAHLILIKSQPYMCPDELKHIQPEPTFFINNQVENNDDGTNGALSSNNTKNNENPFTYNDIEPLRTADDGLPMAILVERGMCTFYDKAVMASKYGDAVKYVIVYDDQVAPNLVPMSSELTTNITLLFVSSLSGQEMRDFIVRRIMSGGLTDTDTILVEMDGISPAVDSPYPALNMAAYFLAAMSGFLAFLIFFGCLLICAQVGWITAAPDEHGRIVLFAGGPGIRVTDGLRIVRSTLLTREQVMKLDEEEFEKDCDNDGGECDEESNSCCCAICLDEFEQNEKVRVLPCSHRFHEPCLIPWLTERHASCPLCKFDVLQYIMDNEENNDDTNTAKDGQAIAIESADGSEEGGVERNNVPASRASSPVRSVWHRLRGWTLISNTPIDASEDNRNNHYESQGEGTDIVSQGSSISEIEMENRRIVIAEGDESPVSDP